jgi:uncharacterized protein (TIGR00369 family)
MMTETTYTDAELLAEKARSLDGLEFLRLVADGQLPPAPVGVLLGMRVTEVELGRVVFELVPTEQHYNPIGGVHGGVYATLLDSACGCAVQSMLPAGARYTSLDLTVKFVRGLTAASGPVRAIGTVTHLGRRTALANAELRDQQDRLCATAVSSLLILRDEAER